MVSLATSRRLSYTLNMQNLKIPTEELSKVSKKHAQKLQKLGIKIAEDFLFHFPFRYEDYSQISPISKITPNETATISGTILEITTKRTWKRKMTITEAFLQDESETIRVVWFNQYYLQNSLQKGRTIRVSGKVSSDEKGLFFSNPAWELSFRDNIHTGRLVPIYPETEGITSRWLRWQIEMLYKNGFKIDELLPAEILQKYNLPEINKALRFIHFPKTEDEYLVAQKRFAFEQMFLIQIRTLEIKSKWSKEKAIAVKTNEKLNNKFLKSLPFKLTNAQQKSAKEILQDLGKIIPMNRLLNGDVGAGKTIVVAIATLQNAHAGNQTVIMVPTEVLAQQHFSSFCKLFKSYNLNIGLLTNSYKLINTRKITRQQMLESIKTGGVDILIGTHAVIQKDVYFKNLSLVIVDEQHRFGVQQRAYFQQTATKINDGFITTIPHFLTMTATPIPRTLTMAFFGNLNISLLDEMPKDRKTIITKVVPARERKKIYEFIRQDIKKGHQAFVILPLVDKSKYLKELKAAITEHERLSTEIFPELNLGLLHGKLKPSEKEKIMSDFAKRKIDILVSTSVIEVGIDIPNATIMIIEDAERFGLSQLHQFRGRIGRSNQQSYCFLFAKNKTARLKTMEKYSDGFKVAEKDLEIRGPGEFMGVRQSGITDIPMQNITNLKLIQFSREEAEKIITTDPSLDNHPSLKSALQKLERKIHLE